MQINISTVTPSTFHYLSSQFWYPLTISLWLSPQKTSVEWFVQCHWNVRTHVLSQLDPCPISVAKVSIYGQDEVDRASLEIAYICYQLFAAEYFRKVDYLGRMNLISLIHITFFVSHQDTHRVCKHPPKSNGPVLFYFLRHISSTPCSLKHCSFFYVYSSSLSLPVMHIQVLFSFTSQPIPVLEVVAKPFL